MIFPFLEIPKNFQTFWIKVLLEFIQGDSNLSEETPYPSRIKKFIKIK
jgi:hypothetical protein